MAGKLLTGKNKTDFSQNCHFFLARVRYTISSDIFIAKFRNSDLLCLKRGVHPDYFVKLDFEIAVDQQTRARDRTFEGVPDSG